MACTVRLRAHRISPTRSIESVPQCLGRIANCCHVRDLRSINATCLLITFHRTVSKKPADSLPLIAGQGSAADPASALFSVFGHSSPLIMLPNSEFIQVSVLPFYWRTGRDQIYPQARSRQLLAINLSTYSTMFPGQSKGQFLIDRTKFSYGQCLIWAHLFVCLIR